MELARFTGERLVSSQVTQKGYIQKQKDLLYFIKQLEKKMKEYLHWFLINGIFGAFVYFGFYQDIDGAKNVAIGFTWLTFILSLFFLSTEISDKCITESIEKGKKGIYMPLMYIFDLAILSCFFWYGVTFTAIAYFLHMILIYSYRSNFDKALEKR